MTMIKIVVIIQVLGPSLAGCWGFAPFPISSGYPMKTLRILAVATRCASLARPESTMKSASEEIIFSHVEGSSSRTRKRNPHPRPMRYNPYKRSLRTIEPFNDRSNSSSAAVENDQPKLSVSSLSFNDVTKASLTLSGTAALQLIQSYYEQNSGVSLRECNILLRNLGDRGEISACDQLFGLMKAKQLRPSIVTYSTLISRAGNWKKISLAESYFDQMRQAGILPDVQTLNSMINAYVKANDILKAKVIFNFMIESKINPTVVTLNTLVNGFAMVGDVQEAYKILNYFNQLGIKVNRRTLSSLIHAHCQTGDHAGAEKVLDKMVSLGYSDHIAAYATLIHSYGSSGKLKEAFSLLDTMRSRGVEPNVVILSSLIHACGRYGQLGPAFALYETICKSNSSELRPNSITCSSLVDCCLKVGEIDKAFGVVQDMRRRGLSMNEVTYTSLISELTKLKQIDRIIEVMLDEQDEQASLSYVSHSQGKRKAVFPSSARTLSTNIEPLPLHGEMIASINDRKVLDILLSASKNGNYGMIFDFMDSLVAQGYIPSDEIFDVILSVTRSEVDLARVRAMVESLNVTKNTERYYALLSSKVYTEQYLPFINIPNRSFTSFSAHDRQTPKNLSEMISAYEAMKSDGVSISLTFLRMRYFGNFNLFLNLISLK